MTGTEGSVSLSVRGPISFSLGEVESLYKQAGQANETLCERVSEIGKKALMGIALLGAEAGILYFSIKDYGIWTSFARAALSIEVVGGCLLVCCK